MNHRLIFGLVVLAAAPLAAQRSATGTLRGQVLSPDSVPAPDAEVSIAELGRHVRADSTGRFHMNGVRAGTYLLEIESARYGRAIERVEVLAGGVTTITIKLVAPVHLQEIVVSAGAVQRQTETYQAANVLAGNAVQEQAEPSLGETLRGQPGVSSTYNGPGASRPMIRGLGGDRVRILEGGVGSGDASSTSPDHAVSVESFTAERIEVIRGPATLLYGSSAIGGVVNVIDGRIPRAAPARRLSGEVTVTGSSAARERTAAAKVNGLVGPLALHVNGLRRVTGDYRVPVGSGTLPNSALETARGALGASWVGRRGFVGAAVSGLNSTYGVPAGEAVTIDMTQRRLDLEGLWRADGAVRDVTVRLGASNYEHTELEGGVVGSRFLNDSREGRIEVGHDLGAAVHGTVGAQAGRRDFSVIGDEAFVPPTRTDRLAAFLFEELDIGVARLQAGARVERQRALDRAAGGTLTHAGVSLSGGVHLEPVPGVILVLSGGRSVKLPSAEELYSNGPHLATNAFERGNPALTREVALAAEAGVRIVRDPVTLTANLYRTAFDAFIYQAFTGAEEDGLPVLAFTQGDAVFQGFEINGTLELVHRGDRHVTLTAQADQVHGTLSAGDTPLPRIPPWRAGGGLRASDGAWHAQVSVRRTAAQQRVAPRETATPGYTLVEALVGVRFMTGAVSHNVTLKGGNLADVTARSHTSFLKDVAPLPGRDVTLTYRLGF